MRKDLKIRFAAQDSLEEILKLREAMETALIRTTDTQPDDATSLTGDLDLEKLASISGDELLDRLSKAFSKRFLSLYKEFEEQVKERRNTGEFIPMREFRDFLAERKNNDSNVVDELIDLTSNEFEIIEIPRTKSASHFITSKSKVANTLFKGSITMNGEKHTVGVEKKNSKKFIDTLVTVDFENMPNLEMSRDISIYDRIVHDAVTSLFVSGGNEYFTPLMIYRTMTGNPKAAPKKEQLQKVSESVSTLSRIRITIKAEEEREKFKLKNSSYEGNLIATEIVKGKYNGKEDEWIHLLRSPVLYDYSSERPNQQISRTEIKMLNTPINKNVEKMELQYYLLQRVETIKNDRAKTSNRIVLQTIYDMLNISAPNPKALSKKQTNIRDNAIIILDYWKKEKFINGYKLIKEGRSVVAIDIIIK